MGWWNNDKGYDASIVEPPLEGTWTAEDQAQHKVWVEESLQRGRDARAAQATIKHEKSIDLFRTAFTALCVGAATASIVKARNGK